MVFHFVHDVIVLMVLLFITSAEGRVVDRLFRRHRIHNKTHVFSTLCSENIIQEYGMTIFERAHSRTTSGSTLAKQNILRNVFHDV